MEDFCTKVRIKGKRPGKELRYWLWIARIGAVFIVALSLCWVLGYCVNPGGFDPKAMDSFEIALFPFGMCFGYLIALRWQLLGGVLSLACLAIFVGARQEVIYIILFGPISLPGVFFYFYGMHMLDQRKGRMMWSPSRN